MWGLEGGSRPWALVIGLVLTSFGWWEAYLPYRTALIVPSLFAFLRDVSLLAVDNIWKIEINMSSKARFFSYKTHN